MKDKQNIQNWAVEAVDPPPGVSSFCTINTLRDIRIQRRNPQFENEPMPPMPPMPPTAAMGNQPESSSGNAASSSSQSPTKLKKIKDIRGDDKPETSNRYRANRG